MKQNYKVVREGTTWKVVDTSGNRVGPLLFNKDIAETLRDRMEASGKKAKS